MSKIPAKEAISPYGPVKRSVRFWGFHTNYSAPTISRALRAAGISSNGGVSLREVLNALGYR